MSSLPRILSPGTSVPTRACALLVAVLLTTACGAGTTDGSGSTPAAILPTEGPTPTTATTATGETPRTGSSPARTTATGPTSDLLVGLCRVREAIDDVATADRRFLAGPHDPLHSLARDLRDAGEASVAARLLEAKNRVESGLRERPPPGGLAGHLDDLIGAARRGLDTLDRPTGGCR